MVRTTIKIAKVCFYGLIILAGVIFAVSNRGKVDLTFWPLPYAVTLPLFIFTIVIFTLGLAMGWLISRFHVLEHWRAHKQASKRVTALENELGTLRTERLVTPVAALPQK